MFKNEWEITKTRVHVQEGILKKMLRKALPESAVALFTQLSEGCANLNYKITFSDGSGPLMLRIYIRDPEAAFREQKIAQLFANDPAAVPVAGIYFVGDCEGYRFAISAYMPGIPLRTVLLQHDQHVWCDLVRDAGIKLAAIGKIEFPTAGFFDRNLQVTRPFVDKEINAEILSILHDPAAAKHLGDARIKGILHLFHEHAALLPDASHHHLVHGDFDPSNMLVDKQHDRWYISAILDWEFAFSGSYLWDISNMLRYAHRMPALYQESFIEGLGQAGIMLPNRWEKITHLLSLVSLIEAVARGNPDVSPKQYKDMYQLIDYEIEQVSL